MNIPDCEECGANKVSMGVETGIKCMICGHEIAPPLTEIAERVEEMKEEG